jgi:uncharacterized LabA/DUF88 family protein
VTPGTPLERVHAYIDGFNLYHGMMAKGWGRYRWLDLRALTERFMRGPQELQSLKYFTSLRNHEPERLLRQQHYLRALDAVGGIEVITGQFEMRKLRCQVCDQWYKRPQEKQTDVNIATHLVADAYEVGFDTLLLFSADSDLSPAVRRVRERFGIQVILIDPPRRHSSELASLADAHLHISEQRIRQSQLPDPVERKASRGTSKVHRPSGWA